MSGTSHISVRDLSVHFSLGQSFFGQGHMPKHKKRETNIELGA